MDFTQRQNRLTTGFFLISLLLHLLLLMIPESSLFKQSLKPEPVYVEVRPPEIRDRELDLPVRPELDKPREEPAKRLGPADQVVEQEMAPEGEDTEDMQQVVKAQPARQQPAVTPQAKADPAPEQGKPAPKNEPDVARRITPEAESKTSTEPQAAPQPMPDLKTLTQISPSAMAQIERDWRRKYREDVMKGDTVWMDTQQDLLISFMRRFRDNIYGVWNYPSYAAERNQHGTCLLRITVDRQGNVMDVKLLESSGHRILDEEAIRAVKAGASYGPLPRAYQNPDLKIMAFFQYNAGQRVNRRAGRLY
ncbi:MAG: energy transducer TonB [Deltaproteobacteria bacterium]|jgi:protein TonB|nr:energy transducer TonB [Deltaproteobacteria bacterium]